MTDDFRELGPNDSPSPDVGTYRISNCVEHPCCHRFCVQQLTIGKRNNGSRYESWDLVAEFVDELHCDLFYAALFMAERMPKT